MLPNPVFLLSALVVLASSRHLRGWVGAFAQVPATLLHEFCHYFVAYITGSQPAPMDIVPKRVGDDWVLGSVRFHAGVFSAALVAIAPLLLLGLAWALWPVAGGPLSSSEATLRGAVFAWCLLGAWPSRVDWEIAFRYPLGLVGLVGLITLSLHFVQVL